MPSFGFWDTGEMQTVPYIFGIAHPTGFPAFVLLGGAFSHIFVLGNVAWRLNLFSALAVALSVWALWFSLVEIGASALLALGGAWFFAFMQVTWFHATRAEVHDLALCFESLAFLCVILWRTRGSSRMLAPAAAALGLALATHPVALWSIPGLVVLAFTGKQRVGAALAVRAVLAGILPLLLYLYIPLRSAVVWHERRDPTLALGLPPGQPYWDYAHTSGSLQAFTWLISGTQFSPHHSLLAIASLQGFMHALSGAAPFIFSQALIGGCAIACVAFVALLRADAPLALGSVLCGFLAAPFTFSYTIEADWQRYLLFLMWIVAFLIGAGAARIRLRPGWALPALLVALAAGMLWANRGVFAERRDLAGPGYVQNVLAHTARNAVVIAPWVLATPLAYDAYVEHGFDGRVLVTADPSADTQARARAWARSRPVYEILDGKPARIVKISE